MRVRRVLTEEQVKNMFNLADDEKKAILSVLATTEKAMLSQEEALRSSYDERYDIIQFGVTTGVIEEARGNAAMEANRLALTEALAAIDDAARVRKAAALEQGLQGVIQAGLSEEEVVRAQLEGRLKILQEANAAKLLTDDDYYKLQSEQYEAAADALDAIKATRALTEQEQLLATLEGTSLALELRREIELEDQAIKMERYLDYLDTMDLTDDEYDALREEKQAAHRERLSKIDLDAYNKDLKIKRGAEQREIKFEQARAKLKVTLWRAAIQLAGKYGKALFLVQQGLAISRGIVDTQAAALEVYKNTPGELSAKAAAAALALKLGYTQVGIIAAQTASTLGSGGLGGGGGGGSYGGGGGAVVATRESLPQILPEDDPQGQLAREVTINIEGLPADGLISTEALRELIAGINEQVGDGVELNVGDVA